MRRLATVAAMTVVFTATVAIAATTGGSFDPNGKPPTKGFVAVEAYKWLRDNHPDTLKGCERKTDQFNDLRQTNVSKFKREAINCLASLGFFDNYPKPDTSTGPDRPDTGYTLGEDIGPWSYYETENVDGHIEGYGTPATRHNGNAWQDNPVFNVRCYANGSIPDPFMWVPWSVDIDNESAQVTYRRSGTATATTVTVYARPGDGGTGLWFLPTVGKGDKLFVTTFKTYTKAEGTAEFDISNLADVVAVLPCYQ